MSIFLKEAFEALNKIAEETEVGLVEAASSPTDARPAKTQNSISNERPVGRNYNNELKDFLAEVEQKAKDKFVGSDMRGSKVKDLRVELVALIPATKANAGTADVSYTVDPTAEVVEVPEDYLAEIKEPTRAGYHWVEPEFKIRQYLTLEDGRTVSGFINAKKLKGIMQRDKYWSDYRQNYAAIQEHAPQAALRALKALEAFDGLLDTSDLTEAEWELIGWLAKNVKSIYLTAPSNLVTPFSLALTQSSNGINSIQTPVIHSTGHQSGEVYHKEDGGTSFYQYAPGGVVTLDVPVKNNPALLKLLQSSGANVDGESTKVNSLEFAKTLVLLGFATQGRATDGLNIKPAPDEGTGDTELNAYMRGYEGKLSPLENDEDVYKDVEDPMADGTEDQGMMEE